MIKQEIKGRRLVSGVGVNDSTYFTQKTIDGKRVVCPFYRTWGNMLNRCYGRTSAEKLPSYIDCTVSEDWLLFSNFKAWMETQDWEGKELDKDILNINNKIYSKENCRFVPSYINNIILTNQSTRGSEPLGVIRRKDTISETYTANLQVICMEKGRYYKNLGVFKDKATAHRAWQIEKSKQIEFAVNLYATDRNFLSEIADALIMRAWQIKVDAINLIETKYL